MTESEMRAGNADRERVVERLRLALDEGRLNLAEYDERLQTAYAAKTYAELEPLVRDLPDAKGVAAPGPSATRRWLGERWGSWAGVSVLTVAIWGVASIADGHLLYFWPVWAIVPWGAVILAETIRGLATGEPARSAARRARRDAERQVRRQVEGDDKS